METSPCALCEKPGAPMKCGACRAAHYCDGKCQKDHWKAHKPECKKVSDARIKNNDGNLDESVVMKERELASLRRKLGNDNEETLACMNLLATLWQRVGKYAQAEALFREAMDRRTREQGRDHSNTLTSISNLALLLQAQGKLGEAEPLYRESLDGSTRVLGRDHPDTLNSIKKFAVLRHAQGHSAEAEAMLTNLLPRLRLVLGDTNPTTAGCISSLTALRLARARAQP